MTAGLVSLFIGSLLASTLVPGGVEVLLYYQVQSGEYAWPALLAVATAGNTLGGAITFAMGMLLEKGLSGSVWHDRIGRFFHLDARSLQRVHRWGIPALFFSWMPIIGDPLCLAGGYLRLATLPSLVMIFAGKLARYAVLLWIYAQPWAQPPGS